MFLTGRLFVKVLQALTVHVCQPPANRIGFLDGHCLESLCLRFCAKSLDVLLHVCLRRMLLTLPLTRIGPAEGPSFV